MAKCSDRSAAPVTPDVYPHGDHAGLAAWWGTAAATAIRRAIAIPPPPDAAWDHDLFHAERAARCAAEHAFKARPDLRPPDSYTRAVNEFRQQHAVKS